MESGDSESKAKIRVARLKWMEEEAEKIKLAKAEAAAAHGLERNAKFDKAWDIAWSYGHASGIREVRMYFDELVELIK